MSPLASKSSELWQFLYIKVTWNFKISKFWKPEVLLEFLNFSQNFSMWSLIIPLNKLAITMGGQICSFNSRAPEAPSMGARESDMSWEIGLLPCCTQQLNIEILEYPNPDCICTCIYYKGIFCFLLQHIHLYLQVLLFFLNECKWNV